MAAPIDFELGGQSYRAGGMSPLVQFHVVRRLAPFMGAMAQLKGSGVQPIMEAVAGMADADCEYVLFACLGTAKRRQGDAWAPVLAGEHQIMFADIDLGLMLQLAARVIQSDLASFFGALFAQDQGAAAETGHA
ncbi:MAG: hypothetical protein KGH75_02450 [Rhodospirillales bacterium]|nr:hypothetical protein [Rhodospirillales bacterium]